MENNTRLTYKQYLTIALASVTLFVVLWNFREVVSFVFSVLGYLTPLFAGACLAFVINVPMKGFEKVLAFCQRKCRLKVRHTLNTYISLVLTIALIAVVVTAFINYMVPDITESATDIMNVAEEWYPEAIKFLSEHGVETEAAEEFFRDFNIKKAFDLLSNYVSFSSEEVVDTVITAAGTTVSIVITVISCIIFSIYMITGKKKLNLQARKLIYAYTPKRFADRACYIGNLVYKTFSSFISSQCLDAFLLAVILYFAMNLFGLPYSGMICVLTGVFALVPYVGAFVSCALGCVLMLIVSPFKALVFFAVFMCVQQLEEQFIYPHLVGSSVGLPAIWTLFAALIGGEIMGVFGVLFFIPLAGVVYTLIKEGAAKRLKEKGILVESPLDTEEREKLRLQTEKREHRRKVRKDKKNARRRKKVYYDDVEDNKE